MGGAHSPNALSERKLLRSSMPLPLERLTLLVSRGLALCGLIGVSSSCQRCSPAAAAAAQGIFLYANNSEPSDLDPHTNISGDAEAIFSALFEGLVVLAPDGHGILPGAAQSWETSADTGRPWKNLTGCPAAVPVGRERAS
jgi:ABC-type transport system substrate-binding protein